MNTVIYYNSYNDEIKPTKIKIFNEDDLFKKAGYKTNKNYGLVFHCKLNDFDYKIFGKTIDKKFNNFKLQGLNNQFMGNLIICKMDNNNNLDNLTIEEYNDLNWSNLEIYFDNNKDNCNTGHLNNNDINNEELIKYNNLKIDNNTDHNDNNEIIENWDDNDELTFEPYI